MWKTGRGVEEFSSVEYTPLYKKGTKKTQIKSMETTFLQKHFSLIFVSVDVN